MYTYIYIYIRNHLEKRARGADAYQHGQQPQIRRCCVALLRKRGLTSKPRAAFQSCAAGSDGIVVQKVLWKTYQVSELLSSLPAPDTHSYHLDTLCFQSWKCMPQLLCILPGGQVAEVSEK